MADEGIITFEEKVSADRHLHFEVSELDEERVNAVVTNELKRCESIRAVCDEAIGSGGSMRSNLLGEVTKLKGNWIFNGVTLRTGIPKAHGVQGNLSLDELRNPSRPGSGETYRFMATLDLLADRGAIEFFIDKEENSPSVCITEVNAELLRQAAQESNLQDKALAHLKKKFSQPQALKAGVSERGPAMEASQMRAAITEAAEKLSLSNPELAKQLSNGLEQFDLTPKQQRGI